MTINEKLEKIIKWFSENCQEELRQLDEVTAKEYFNRIENLIEVKIPSEFIELYTKYNGEKGKGIGTFMGHIFLPLEEIYSELELFKKHSKPKPEDRIVTNSDASERLILEIISEVRNAIPKRKAFGILNNKWTKLTFSCSPGSIGGPYLFRNDSDNEKEKQIIKLNSDSQDKVFKLTKSLYEIEAKSYGWDELEFEVFWNGNYDVKRIDYNFTDEANFTSYPERAIKKKYYHFQWIPIFSDYGGNFIGIDMDPDIKGKVGQIIVFGRDEDNMFVVGNSLNDFFDFTLQEISRNDRIFFEGKHMHEVYKELIVPN